MTKPQLRRLIGEEIQKLNRNNHEVIEEGFWKDLALMGLLGLHLGQAGSKLSGNGSLINMLRSNPPAKIVQSITNDAAENDMQGVEKDAKVLQGYLTRLQAEFAQGENPELSTRLNADEEIALSNIQQSLENSSNPQAQAVLDAFHRTQRGSEEFAARSTASSTTSFGAPSTASFGGQFK
tara:strand:+ start:1964 stop:2503 length:540 start_codon:yes stop_codon:yes gene_type:complete